MPEVAESPSQTAVPEYVPPQAPPPDKPLTVKAGDKFREAFEKLSKTENQAVEVDTPKPPPVEKPTEVPKEPEVKPTSPEPEVKPLVTEKPSSPLDVITADKTSEKEDVLDELKDIPVEIEAKDEKQKANWKALREMAGKAIREAKELRGKIETTPKAQPEEVLALAKERDEFKTKYEKQEEALKALNYQYSETFQNMVADRDAHVGKIQSRVERLGGDTEKFMAALAMPDGKAKNAQIKEALAEVDSEDRTRVHTLLETLDEKNEKLAEEAKNSSSRWEELQSKRQAELAEEQAKGLKTIETTFSQIAAALPEQVKTLREVPEDVPDAATWNAEIKAARETAIRVLTPGGSDQKESMEIAIKGGRYDSLEKRYLDLHRDWVERGKRLAEYDSGGPEFKGGQKPKTEVKLAPSQKYHQALEKLKSSPTE